MVVHEACCPSARSVEEAFEAWSKEVLGDDCRWAFDYYVNLDNRNVDRSVNIVVRIGHLGPHHTGCSHRLIDIDRCDICTVPCPSGVSCLTGIDLVRAGSHRPIAADPRIVDARGLYFRRVDDRLVERSCYEAQSVGKEQWWFG